ncbi:MAG: thymidylate kinase [Nitrososphaerota archaeon]|nr:thymidylate kinase [Nitrososphaerota archaeon]
MSRLGVQDKSRGKLIAVEGIDGSGKSTQLHLLDKWLRHLGALVFNTEWNSSAIVKEITPKRKKKALLTPTGLSLLHATDFADRYERNVLPLLRAGYFVLADGYVYTAYARDAARGCHPQWARGVYSFATKPDAVFYYNVPIDVSVKRIISERQKLKFYEAGMDLSLSNDEFDSYRIFQSRVIEQYKTMVSKERFIVMDGTLDIELQQRMMRERVLNLLPPELATIASKELHVP